jgi:hypothetical protein
MNLRVAEITAPRNRHRNVEAATHTLFESDTESHWISPSPDVAHATFPGATPSSDPIA